jgi:hypothetical protein
VCLVAGKLRRSTARPCFCHDQRITLDGAPRRTSWRRSEGPGSQAACTARGAPGREEPRKGYGARRSEGNPCPRPANRDTTRDAGAIAEPRARRALAPECIASAADQLPLLRPAQGGGDKRLSSTQRLRAANFASRARGRHGPMIRQRHASARKIKYGSVAPVRPVGAPSTRGRLGSAPAPRGCGRPAVEAGEGIHDGYRRKLPSPRTCRGICYSPLADIASIFRSPYALLRRRCLFGADPSLTGWKTNPAGG